MIKMNRLQIVHKHLIRKVSAGIAQKKQNNQQNTHEMSHGPDALCGLFKQKQTRTKKREKLTQTIKHNNCKFWRKHSITKLTPGIVQKPHQKNKKTHSK